MDEEAVTRSKMIRSKGEESLSRITDVQLPFSVAPNGYESAGVASDAPLLVRSPRGKLLRLGFASCDLALHTWQLNPPSFLVPELPTEFTGTFGSVHAGGGLVMMQKYAKQEHHIVVSNPQTKSQRVLPSMIEFHSPEILGIFVNPTTKSYKIPVIQRKFNLREIDLVIMQEYHSISDTWEFAGQWRNRFQVEPIGAVYVNETLYFLTYHRQAFLTGDEEQVHHIYYLSDGVWQRLELPGGLGVYAFASIFEHRGKLMLLAGLRASDAAESALTDVYIWEHNWKLMRWMDISSMPLAWVDELDKSPPEERRCNFDITSGGNFVCVASSNGRVAVFDAARHVWSWLPKCDVERYPDGGKVFILERELDISP